MRVFADVVNSGHKQSRVAAKMKMANDDDDDDDDDDDIDDER